jgi:hypothetical protein
VIPNLNTRDVLANRSHDAGAFVAQSKRSSRAPVTAHRMQIAVANAGCFYFHEDFIRMRCFELCLFNRKWLTLFP